MAQAAGSVVYQMAGDERWPDFSVLRQAQKYAVDNELPMAVAFCYDPSEQEDSYQDVFSDLYELEGLLASKRVPLMVLIGDSDQRFGWYFDYVKPRRVYTKSVSSVSSNNDLEPHPIVWPGEVIGIKELTKLLDNKQLVC